MTAVRCPSCGKLLCHAEGKVQINCRRCKSIITFETKPPKPEDGKNTQNATERQP